MTRNAAASPGTGPTVLASEEAIAATSALPLTAWGRSANQCVVPDCDCIATNPFAQS